MWTCIMWYTESMYTLPFSSLFLIKHVTDQHHNLLLLWATGSPQNFDVLIAIKTQLFLQVKHILLISCMPCQELIRDLRALLGHNHHSLTWGLHSHLWPRAGRSVPAWAIWWICLSQALFLECCLNFLAWSWTCLVAFPLPDGHSTASACSGQLVTNFLMDNSFLVRSTTLTLTCIQSMKEKYKKKKC